MFQKGGINRIHVCKGHFMEAVIRNAIETGEVIAVQYMGGTTPGLVRRICPLALDGDIVRAVCCESDQEKTYRVSLMRHPGSQKIRSDAASFLTMAPVEGIRFAAGWNWAIPEAMRTAIGIQWLPRVQGGSKVWQWIDTGMCAFNEGDMLYDDYTAYLPSGDPRMLSRYALQVLEAKPMSTDDEGALTVQCYHFQEGRIARVAGGLRGTTQVALGNLLRQGVSAESDWFAEQ